MRFEKITVSQMWGVANYIGAKTGGTQTPWTGRWIWLTYKDLAKFPGYEISEMVLRNELSRRDGMMERVCRFAFNPDGSTRSIGLMDFQNFLGSLDSMLFSFRYPEYYRHRLLHWRGMDLRGWEVNYYFIGFGFWSFGYSWTTCSSFINTWKILCYQTLPSAGCLAAAQAGFNEAIDRWREMGPSVVARIRQDDEDWQAKLQRVRRMHPQ